MRGNVGFSVLTACAVGLASLRGEAKVLVYEGFDAADYDLKADSHETLSSRSLAKQTVAIGTSTSNWGAMGGSQVKVFGPDYGLDFPQDMKDIGFTARGGSVGLNWKENNASQLRAMYHTLATDVLKVSSGKLYFRELLAIQANCAARLYQKDSLTTGDGSHYGFGFTTGPSGNDYNLLLNGKSAMGFFFWKNKSDQIVLSFAVVDKNSQRTIVDLVTGVALDTTYVCYAEIDVNASEGKEAIRANAVAVLDYSTTLTWKSVGEVDFITETTYPTCMAVAGPYQSKNGLFRADEIIVATEMGEVLAANANAPVLEGATLAWDDATGSCNVTATMKKNSASFVASAKTSDTDGSPVVSTASSVIGPGESDTVALSGFAADTTYRVWAIAGEGDDSDTKVAGSLYSGTLALAKVRDANEYGCVAGQVRVSRANADPYPLVVNYGFSSAAEGAAEGQTWEVPSGSVTIPSGETSVIIELMPRVDMTVTKDIAVTVALTAGAYPSVSQTVDLMLANLTTRAEYNTWVAPEAGSAAVDANWSYGHAPLPTEDVLFDGYISSANCTWDADSAHTVKSWTQNHDFAGIVDLQTVYPGKGDFTVMTVTGAMTLESGTITHPLSRQTWDNISDYIADLKANETYRIRLDVGSLTVGANGRIDATNKGYYQANTGDFTMPKASHGGWFGGNGLAPYDNIKEPIHIGLGDKPTTGNYTVAIGGGAVYIVSTGDAVVDGTIRADTGRDCWNLGLTLRGAAAAGSVYLKANSVTGSGTISASAGWTDEQNNKGCGGRVAVIATSSTPVDFTTLKLKATVEPFKSNGTSECDNHGSAGTVFVKDASQTYGTLLVDNVANMPAQAFTRPATIVTDEGDWTFDRVGLGHNAVLVISEGTTLKLANGIDGVFSLNAAGETNRGLIRYEGGDLDLGTKASQTMDGVWMFTAHSPYTFPCNLTVQNGAMIGIPGYGNVKDNDNNEDFAKRTLASFVSCCLTVQGDLNLTETGYFVADGYGFQKHDHNSGSESRGLLGYGTHGGRHMAKGKGTYSSSTSFYYKGYDSVFSPSLPGCSGYYGNGSSASGGVILLTVSGHFTLDGSMSACGTPVTARADQNNAGGAGGTICVTAGSMSGSGSMSADGGSISSTQGGGGRIAIRLTSANADFSRMDLTRITASGRCYGSHSTSANGNSSPGTIYLQSSADQEKCGRILIQSRIGQGYNNTENKNPCSTEIASLGYGGDALTDYKRVKVEVGDYATAAVNTDLQVSQLALAKTTARLDLEGHKLTVNKLTGVDGEGALIKVKPGTYTAAQLSTLGLAVIDSSADENGENATGTVEVKGTGFVVFLN